MKTQRTRALLFVLFLICLLASCKDIEFLYSATSRQLFSKISQKTSAQIAIRGIKCDQREIQEILSMLPKDLSLDNPTCKGEFVYLTIAASIVSENIPSKPDEHFKLVRVNIPDIEQEKKFFETRGIKLKLSEEFLNLINKKLNLAPRDIKVKISIKNNQDDDLLVTGSDFWIDGDPHEQIRNEKLSPGQEATIEFSELANALVLSKRSPVSFYVTRRKIEESRQERESQSRQNQPSAEQSSEKWKF